MIASVGEWLRVEASCVSLDSTIAEKYLRPLTSVCHCVQNPCKEIPIMRIWETNHFGIPRGIQAISTAYSSEEKSIVVCTLSLRTSTTRAMVIPATTSQRTWMSSFSQSATYLEEKKSRTPTMWSLALSNSDERPSLNCVISSASVPVVLKAKPLPTTSREIMSRYRSRTWHTSRL